MNQEARKPITAVLRFRWFYTAFILVIALFGMRAFYLQIIRHDYYVKAARSDQLKEYNIAATRGVIKAYDGDEIVPIVLNQKFYIIYADPMLIKDSAKTAGSLAQVLGGQASAYEQKLKTKDTRYVILAKKATEEQQKIILAHKYSGIGAQQQSYRTYPDGTLASQLLGFVNADGKGVYGLEQAMNKELSGTPGKLKAVTDINGVPLAANTDNILIEPAPGDDVILTIDMAMQKQLENILQQGLKNAKSDSGSALIMDPNSGAIKAMANWPTYDPTNYANVDDANVFNNAAVSSPLEIGSVMKPLTTAAALDLGAVNANTSYYDPSFWTIDGYKITNIEEDGGAGQRNIADILSLSLNTGATWLLMQMSKPGGTEITKSGREHWHDYMVNHFLFGKPTGIEQGYEADGYIPDPNEGYGLNLTYANTSFGQGMTATPLQLGAAFSAAINGGTYYQPRLIDQVIDANNKVIKKQPHIMKRNVVKPAVSKNIQDLLNIVISKRHFQTPFNQSLYSVGGKTGTAEIAKPGGGYYDDQFNGTYVGFVGGDAPQYVIVVRVNQPKIGGYAGTMAAQPIFGDLAHMLIDNFDVAPRTH